MKKAIYLVTLLFAIVLMNTSCTKDNTKPDVKTLNSDWKNLTWSQTFINSTNASVDYPRISFKLNATCDTLTSTSIDSQTAKPVYISYINITLNSAGDMVTLTPTPKFGGSNDAISYKYEKNNGKITLDNGVNHYRYVLIIN